MIHEFKIFFKKLKSNVLSYEVEISTIFKISRALENIFYFL